MTPAHVGPAELELQCSSCDTAAAGRHAGAEGTFPAPGALLRAAGAPFAGAAIMPAATYPSTLSTVSYVVQPWQAPTAPTTPAAAATEFTIKAVQASEYAAMQQQQQQPPAAPAYVPMQQQPPVSSAYVPPFRRNNTNTQVHGCPKPLAPAQTSLPTPANPAQPLYDAPGATDQWSAQQQSQPQQVHRPPAAAPAAGCMPAPAASINVAPAASSIFSMPLQQQFKGSAPPGFDALGPAAARHIPAAVPVGAGSLGPAASTAPGVLADGTWFGMQQQQPQQFRAPVQGKPVGMAQYHAGFVSAAPVQAGAPATAVGYNSAPYAPAPAGAMVGYNGAPYTPAAAVGYSGAIHAAAPVGYNEAAYAPAAAAVGYSTAPAAAAGGAAAYDAADEEDELEDMLRLLGVQP